MIIPTDKEMKHIKDQNVDTQGYSEHKITKIKTELISNLIWGNNKVKNMDSKKSASALAQVMKITMPWEQTWKYIEFKLYKLADRMRD